MSGKGKDSPLLPKEFNWKKVKKVINAHEAQWNILPSSKKIVKKNNEEFLVLAFDKRVVYENDSEQANNLEKATLDYQGHARSMETVFKGYFGDDVSVSAKVSPKRKTFSIPFVNITIPWSRKRSNLVRQPDEKLVRFFEDDKIRNGVVDQPNNKLRSQACRVEVKIKRSDIEGMSSKDLGFYLFAAMNQAAKVHTKNTNANELIDESLAQRRSMSPLRWIFRYTLGKLTPRALARRLPHFFKRRARVYPMGSPFAERVIDQPIFNSAVQAHAATTAVYTGVGAVAVAGLVAAAYFGVEACGKSGGGSLGNSSGMGMSIGMLVGSSSNSMLASTAGCAFMLSAPSASDQMGFLLGYSVGTLFNNNRTNAGLDVSSVQSTTETTTSDNLNKSSNSARLAVSAGGIGLFATRDRISHNPATDAVTLNSKLEPATSVSLNA